MVISTEMLDRPATMALASAELVVVDGLRAGTRVRISGTGTQVGSAPGCQLQLVDRGVSRMHFIVRLEVGGVRLIDGGSTNGTHVDHVRVHDVTFESSATIRVGTCTLRLEVGDLAEHVPISSTSMFGNAFGASHEMRRIFSILERAAPTDSTILLHGETGTGKEVIARAIHEQSRRARAPFVTVDCGAIAESLIESELFGHVRGAFSNALHDREGLFEQANGGTIFLDELGELAMPLQPKLLRLLETRELRRVGDNSPRKVDVRVIAATNCPLMHAINQGTFRDDLYYRLAVVEVTVPPLRARRDDIIPLARQFYAKYAGPDAVFPESLTPSLLGRDWPGNVRELRNFIDRCVTLGMSPSDAPPRASDEPPEGLAAFVPTHLPLKDARRLWGDQFEALYVRALLERAGGNVTRAASIAGVNRRWLQRMLATLRIDADE